MTAEENQIEVGGLKWSPEFLSGGSGILNPDNGIYYYTQEEAITEADKQGLRLPTAEEYEQFIKRTTHEWTERDGRSGMLFTDRKKWYEFFKHANSIFFPAAGHPQYVPPTPPTFSQLGIYGCYWSSSVSTRRRHPTLYFQTEPRQLHSDFHYDPRGSFPVRCLLK